MPAAQAEGAGQAEPLGRDSSDTLLSAPGGHGCPLPLPHPIPSLWSSKNSSSLQVLGVRGSSWAGPWGAVRPSGSGPHCAWMELPKPHSRVSSRAQGARAGCEGPWRGCGEQRGAGTLRKALGMQMGTVCVWKTLCLQS